MALCRPRQQGKLFHIELDKGYKNSFYFEIMAADINDKLTDALFFYRTTLITSNESRQEQG